MNNRIISIIDEENNSSLKTLNIEVPSAQKLSNIEFKNGYVNITFSDNLLDENISDETRNLMATAIYYTLSNLTEVNGIRIYVGDKVLQEIPQQ